MAEKPVPDGTEEVALAEGAAEDIAQKTADLVAASEIKSLRADIAELKAAFLTPKRTDLGDVPAGGIVAKGSDTATFTGGDDLYTLSGEDDAEVGVNLFLTQKMLQAVGKDLSPRAKHVMLSAGEAALKTAPKIISAKGIDATLVKSQYGQMRTAAYKALVSTTANSGDEWVPTFASSELWRDTHLATQIASLVRRVDMPTNPYDLPTQTADATFKYASSENTAVTASNFTTDKATLTARKIQAEVNFSGEVTEDSIIPIVPAIRADLVRRGAQTIDDLIVHGDTETGGTGNANSDDTGPTAGSFYLALDGMRKFAVVTNTGQTSNVAGALTSATFNTIRGLLGKYGARPSDLAIVSGTSQYLAALTITEVLTQEKYGTNATVLTGELARFFGIPWFLSESIPLTSIDKVDADGKYTTTSPSSNDTKGWLVLFNRNHWVAGFRRDFQVESFRDIQKDMNILVASFRMGLTTSGIATTHTASGRNLTV